MFLLLSIIFSVLLKCYTERIFISVDEIYNYIVSFLTLLLSVDFLFIFIITVFFIILFRKYRLIVPEKFLNIRIYEWYLRLHESMALEKLQIFKCVYTKFIKTNITISIGFTCLSNSFLIKLWCMPFPFTFKIKIIYSHKQVYEICINIHKLRIHLCLIKYFILRSQIYWKTRQKK